MAFSVGQWRLVRRLWEWQAAGISNRITFAALSLTMVVALIIGVISYGAVRLLIKRNVTASLESQARLVEQKLFSDLNSIARDLADLSNNSFIANGLVDSLGRDLYLLPFLREHRLPIAAKVVIILCDFKGKPFASNQKDLPALPRGIHGVQGSLAKGKPHAETLRSADGLHLALSTPVIFPPTGHTEGVLVGMVRLQDIFASAIRHLDVGYHADLLVDGASISGKDAAGADYETVRMDKGLTLDGLTDALTFRVVLGQKRSEAFAPLRWVAVIYALIGLSTLMLVFLLSRSAARRLTEPLASLSRMVSTISESGSLQVTAEVKGRDEVATLSSVFNDMLGRLRASHEHLEAQVEERTHELKEAERRLRDLIDGLGPYMFVGLMTTDGRILEANQPALSAARLSPEDVKNKPVEETYWWSYSEQVQRQLRGAIERAAQGEPSRYDVQVRVGEEQFVMLDFSIQPLLDSSGKVVYLVPSGVVITERKKAEERATRLSRLYSVLSRINEAIVRTKEPEELYRQACSIIVEVGGFRMAWIGIIDPDTLRVNPVAVCGHEDGYLKMKHMSADENLPEGRGQTGIAVRTGGYAICNDIANDPMMALWREEALKRGYHSSAAIALKSGAQVVGALNIYSEVAYFFQEEEEEEEEEIKLLKALAEDISYAVEAMAIEKQRITSEQELKMLSIELEDRVKQRTQQLKDSQRALMGLVEDLNQKSDELSAAIERLREVDRLKSMFIASMSHELRTPLNSVIGFSSILLNQWKGPLNDDQKLMLSTVLRSGKHLFALINDVIDVSKVEAGKIDVQRAECDLYDIMNETAELIKKDAADKGLELQVEPVHVNLKTDRRRLLQCVLNLLSNAVKFTERGSVRVAARRMSGGALIEISVEDTGIGIRREDLPKLFKAFSRLDSPLQSTVPGTGLGLYLTRKLVTDALQGDISAASEPGKGSRFTLTIPLETKTS